ncbi:2'-5' RNA ligase family protein [Agromyces sp. Marseille-P2726]|uniref:2'-5' RNA ligase family protein n=1 Tax=Agromyces sp. Marseille-P2726 TaxID=2709132 RepID=UPI00156D8EB3|nr:2'-5' RNA ligase family protein [Agromyces sp. Marseille-P2726]
MARFVVVLTLAALDAGDEFTVADWPLHVTLVEPFSTERPAIVVAGALRTALAGSAVVRATAGEDAMFGRRRNVPVTLVHDGGQLSALRTRALDGLDRAGVDTGHVRADFRPHVTRKRHGRLHAGQRVPLESVALIDMRPPEGSHHRRVVDAWRLGPRASPGNDGGGSD